ncbi:sugar phosphate isomerase/epimerase family protein [Paenibacillus oryzisoli]|uniref:sugar phosphate isomerase/epimerase family protein n=1 Tax=Paenibacillus oryzisoli TaxID=1850517 RepID=UPI003D293C18
MSKVKMTCFADEISQDLDEQLDVLQAEGLSYIEVRNVWGKNVLDLNEEELQTIRQMLDQRGFAVSSIASPVGKYPIGDDFAPQLEAMHRAVRAAKALNAAYIRVFSYFVKEDEDLDAVRDEVLSRMKQLLRLAEDNELTMILENDNQLYGSSDDRCLDILQHCASDSLRLAFDPGNFVINHVKPADEAFPKLNAYTAYIHVKDAINEPRQFVPAGKGEGQIDQLLVLLRAQGFAGFLSVEPHLTKYLPYSSDPKRVVTAIHALKDALARAEMVWE